MLFFTVWIPIKHGNDAAMCAKSLQNAFTGVFVLKGGQGIGDRLKRYSGAYCGLGLCFNYWGGIDTPRLLAGGLGRDRYAQTAS